MTAMRLALSAGALCQSCTIWELQVRLIDEDAQRPLFLEGLQLDDRRVSAGRIGVSGERDDNDPVGGFN